MGSKSYVLVVGTRDVGDKFKSYLTIHDDYLEAKEFSRTYGYASSSDKLRLAECVFFADPSDGQYAAMLLLKVEREQMVQFACTTIKTEKGVGLAIRCRYGNNGTCQQIQEFFDEQVGGVPLLVGGDYVTPNYSATWRIWIRTNDGYGIIQATF